MIHSKGSWLYVASNTAVRVQPHGQASRNSNISGGRLEFVAEILKGRWSDPEVVSYGERAIVHLAFPVRVDGNSQVTGSLPLLQSSSSSSSSSSDNDFRRPSSLNPEIANLCFKLLAIS